MLGFFDPFSDYPFGLRFSRRSCIRVGCQSRKFRSPGLKYVHLMPVRWKHDALDHKGHCPIVEQGHPVPELSKGSFDPTDGIIGVCTHACRL